MKRKWLYVGVAVASILQFFFEGLWYNVLFKNSYIDFQAIQRSTPQLTFNFLSEVAFAFVFGLLYLHVPNEKRSTKGGAILGTILGLLIGIYQSLEWYGSFNVSLSVVAFEILKTTMLGTICGIAISFAELKINPRTHPGAT